MDQAEENKKEIESLKKEIEELKKRVKKLEPGHTYGSSPDVLFENAIELFKDYDEVSASLLQRRLTIGYSRAARILDQLEEKGYVGKAEGAQPRKVLKK